MIDRDHELSVTKQAAVVGIARSTVYYLPRPVPAADLDLMRQIDKLYTEFPFAGARMLRRLLAANGSQVGRRHVKALMRRMGIEALYRRPRTTKPEPGHMIYPYLLRGLEICAAEPGVGDGHHVHSDGEGLRLPGGRCSTGSRDASCRGACRSRWKRRSVSRLRRRHWRSTASRRSSTRIKARSSPVPRLRMFCVRTTSRSAWTARALGGTTCSFERLWRTVQIRGGLSARLRQRVGGTHLDRAVSRSLQSPPPAFEP